VNRDGKSEIVIDHGGWTTIGVYSPDLYCPVLQRESYRAPYFSQDFDMAIGDLNGDGLKDLAFVRNGLYILYGRPNPYKQINLSKGWNFVSFPLLPGPSTPVGTVLAGVMSDLRIVWGYDAATKTWLKYPNGVGQNALTAIEAGKGYWIYMNQANAINLSGWTHMADTIHLSEGWNLIGFSGVDSQSANFVFTMTQIGWESIWGWSNGRWTTRTPVWATLSLPLVENIAAGKAYWLKVKKGHAQDMNLRNHGLLPSISDVVDQ
jgi:hypothetical protein